MQVYFLSVLLNACAGLMLITDRNSPKAFFSNRQARLVIGALAVVTGFLKLFIIVQPDIIIIGDLFPVIAGIAGGASILIEYYKEYTTVEISLNDFFEKLFVKGKKYVGILCLIVSLLHFLFPRLTIL